jgi:hypothetical protein
VDIPFRFFSCENFQRVFSMCAIQSTAGAYLPGVAGGGGNRDGGGGALGDTVGLICDDSDPILSLGSPL